MCSTPATSRLRVGRCTVKDILLILNRTVVSYVLANVMACYDVCGVMPGIISQSH